MKSLTISIFPNESCGDCMIISINNISIILFHLCILLLSGFLITRITKLFRLPNVSGYILAGILIGPYSLRIVEMDLIKEMEFIGDIALAFIAFDVGKFLKKELFKNSGIQAIVITLFESLFAGIIITFSMYYIFALDWSFSLLLGAIATATAPASTMMTINQYKAKGDFVNILLQVVALDDIVCLVTFSLIASLINAGDGGHFSFAHASLPILFNIGGLILGYIAGLILSKLINTNRSDDNRLILTTTLLLAISSLASIFSISPLLACMVFGATYINKTNDEMLYYQINKFTPPIFSLFFVISGTKLDIGALRALGIVGVAYFIIRIIGKYIGAYLGSLAVGADETIRNFLGFALIPQAGVSIGLAYLGQRILPEAIGNMLMTIILASSVLYELIGPISAKLSLICSGAIKFKKSKTAPRIVQICQDL